MKKLIIISYLLLASSVFAQGLFESTVTNESEEESRAEEKTFELNGYVRGVFYGGKIPDRDKLEMKSNYGEAALKLRIRKQKMGDAFAEVRFRKGNEFGVPINEVDFVEAYVNAYVGNFDFRIGQQIVVWGRADGFNPTNNITPFNMLTRSPDEDDRRLGNFLIRSHYNAHPVRLEAIWVPSYSSSNLPTEVVPLPQNINFLDPVYPNQKLQNGALAFRFNLELASFDGSISYFNGYNPFPGIDGSVQNLTVQPKAYRMHVVGADFSTTTGSFGLRGEFAYRKSFKDFKDYIYIPNPDLLYVFGMDKEYGDFSIIFQYIGRYVLDFSEINPSSSLVDGFRYEIEAKNRMIASQQDETSHSTSFRIAHKFLHETLNIELFGLYNFTTEESFFRPKIRYDLADDFSVIAGSEIYNGPDDSLYGSIDEFLTSAFFEIKLSF